MEVAGTGPRSGGHPGTPFTADYIAYRAALHPAALAVIDNGREISYAEFSRDIGRCIHGLRSFALSVGNTVAIQWTSLYPHWPLILACEKLGFVTFTYTKQQATVHRALLAAMDLVVGDAVPGRARSTVHAKLDRRHLGTANR